MKEEWLIAGLERREKAVFDYIFHSYYSALCVYSMQYLNDRQSVEDLVQDFFVSLWIESSRLNIHTSLKAYLFAGVRNRCLDCQKHEKVVRKYQTYALYAPTGDVNSTEYFYAESELRQAIQNSLIKLPARCREIFEMSRMKGLTNQEISTTLGLTKRTVELQISNALKILRKELAEFLPLVLVWMLIQ